MSPRNGSPAGDWHRGGAGFDRAPNASATASGASPRSTCRRPFPRRPRCELQIDIVHEAAPVDARVRVVRALRLAELDRAGGRALFAALARETVDAATVFRVVGG